MCRIRDLLDCAHSPEHTLKVWILRILSDNYHEISPNCKSTLREEKKDIKKEPWYIPSSLPQLICVFGCTDGPAPVEIEDGPAEVVVCEDGVSDRRKGYFRALAPAARVNLEVLEPIFAD